MFQMKSNAGAVLQCMSRCILPAVRSQISKLCLHCCGATSIKEVILMGLVRLRMPEISRSG